MTQARKDLAAAGRRKLEEFRKAKLAGKASDSPAQADNAVAEGAGVPPPLDLGTGLSQAPPSEPFPASNGLVSNPVATSTSGSHPLDSFTEVSDGAIPFGDAAPQYTAPQQLQNGPFSAGWHVYSTAMDAQPAPQATFMGMGSAAPSAVPHMPATAYESTHTAMGIYSAPTGTKAVSYGAAPGPALESNGASGNEQYSLKAAVQEQNSSHQSPWLFKTPTKSSAPEPPGVAQPLGYVEPIALTEAAAPLFASPSGADGYIAPALGTAPIPFWQPSSHANGGDDLAAAFFDQQAASSPSNQHWPPPPPMAQTLPTGQSRLSGTGAPVEASGNTGGLEASAATFMPVPPMPMYTGFTPEGVESYKPAMAERDTGTTGISYMAAEYAAPYGSSYNNSAVNPPTYQPFYSLPDAAPPDTADTSFFDTLAAPPAPSSETNPVEQHAAPPTQLPASDSYAYCTAQQDALPFPPSARAPYTHDALGTAGPAEPTSASSGGYPAPSGDYPAPSGGYPAPSGGYPAPSGGYPASSGGYPAPSGDYPASSGGYPAPSGDYPASSGGYPASSAEVSSHLAVSGGLGSYGGAAEQPGASLSDSLVTALGPPPPFMPSSDGTYTYSTTDYLQAQLEGVAPVSYTQDRAQTWGLGSSAVSNAAPQPPPLMPFIPAHTSSSETSHTAAPYQQGEGYVDMQSMQSLWGGATSKADQQAVHQGPEGPHAAMELSLGGALDTGLSSGGAAVEKPPESPPRASSSNGEAAQQLPSPPLPVSSVPPPVSGETSGRPAEATSTNPDQQKQQQQQQGGLRSKLFGGVRNVWRAVAPPPPPYNPAGQLSQVPTPTDPAGAAETSIQEATPPFGSSTFSSVPPPPSFFSSVPPPPMFGASTKAPSTAAPPPPPFMPFIPGAAEASSTVAPAGSSTESGSDQPPPPQPLEPTPTFATASATDSATSPADTPPPPSADLSHATDSLTALGESSLAADLAADPVPVPMASISSGVEALAGSGPVPEVSTTTPASLEPNSMVPTEYPAPPPFSDTRPAPAPATSDMGTSQAPASSITRPSFLRGLMFGGSTYGTAPSAAASTASSVLSVEATSDRGQLAPTSDLSSGSVVGSLEPVSGFSNLHSAELSDTSAPGPPPIPRPSFLSSSEPAPKPPPTMTMVTPAQEPPTEPITYSGLPTEPAPKPPTTTGATPAQEPMPYYGLTNSLPPRAQSRASETSASEASSQLLPSTLSNTLPPQQPKMAPSSSGTNLFGLTSDYLSSYKGATQPTGSGRGTAEYSYSYTPSSTSEVRSDSYHTYGLATSTTSYLGAGAGGASAASEAVAPSYLESYLDNLLTDMSATKTSAEDEGKDGDTGDGDGAAQGGEEHEGLPLAAEDGEEGPMDHSGVNHKPADKEEANRPFQPIHKSESTSQFTVLQQYIDELTEQKLELERGLTAQSRLSASLAEENSEAHERINVLAGTVDKLQKKVKQYEHEMTAQVLALEAMSVERDAAKSHISDTTERSNQLAAEVVSLEQSLLHARAAKIKLEKRMEERDGQMAKLERQLAALQSEMRSHSDELGQAQLDKRQLLVKLKQTEGQLRTALEGGQSAAAGLSKLPPPVASSDCEVQCTLEQELEAEKAEKERSEAEAAAEATAAGATAAEAEAAAAAAAAAAAEDEHERSERLARERRAQFEKQLSQATSMDVSGLDLEGKGESTAAPHGDPASTVLSELTLARLDSAGLAGTAQALMQLARWLPAGPITGASPLSAITEEEVRVVSSVHVLLEQYESMYMESVQQVEELQARVNELHENNLDFMQRLGIPVPAPDKLQEAGQCTASDRRHSGEPSSTARGSTAVSGGGVHALAGVGSTTAASQPDPGLSSSGRPSLQQQQQLGAGTGTQQLGGWPSSAAGAGSAAGAAWSGEAIRSGGDGAGVGPHMAVGPTGTGVSSSGGGTVDAMQHTGGVPAAGAEASGQLPGGVRAGMTVESGMIAGSSDRQSGATAAELAAAGQVPSGIWGAGPSVPTMSADRGVAHAMDSQHQHSASASSGVMAATWGSTGFGAGAGFPTSGTAPGFPTSGTAPGFPTSGTAPGFPTSTTGTGFPSTSSPPATSSLTGIPLSSFHPAAEAVAAAAAVTATAVSALPPDRASTSRTSMAAHTQRQANILAATEQPDWMPASALNASSAGQIQTTPNKSRWGLGWFRGNRSKLSTPTRSELI